MTPPQRRILVGSLGAGGGRAEVNEPVQQVADKCVLLFELQMCAQRCRVIQKVSRRQQLVRAGHIVVKAIKAGVTRRCGACLNACNHFTGMAKN